MSIRWIRAMLVRLGGAFRNDSADREFAEELECHLQMHVDDNVRAGMTQEEARRQALLKLGGVEAVKELHRDRRGLPMAETFVRDLRHGLRRLARSPGFTAIAVLSLTIGIGANTAVFSLINAAVLQTLPVENADEIVSVTNAVSSRMFPGFSYPNYRDYRDRNDVFSGLIAYRFAPLSLSHDGVNERLWGYLVTGNYFDVLGVRANRGRLIAPDDDRLPGAHPVAVVSYQSWQQRFGADPGIVGKDLVVNGRSYTVIGVAPQEFFGTEVIAAPEMWFPMAMQAQIEVGNEWLEERDVEPLFLQGRLKPGVSSARAVVALNSIAEDLEREYPDANEGKRVAITSPGFLGGGAMRGAVLGFTGVLMVVVAIALLLACTNLANLLLARAADRRKEIAVRLAMGASRPRIVTQLMVESMLLAAASGVSGFLLACWLVDLAVAFKPPVDVPLSVNLRLDYRVLLFTAFVSLATGVLFGLVPSLQATKVDLLTALKDKSSFGGSRRSRLTSGLIVAQVALSLVLLVCGGLMLRALERAQTMDIGYDPGNAVEAAFDLRLQGYDVDRGREFQRALLERVRSLPGVHHAGLVDLPPVDLHFSRTSVFVQGRLPERGGNAPRAMYSRVSPGYFRAMGTPIELGRDFGEQDDANAAQVAIVNETFARDFWPGEDPLGKRFRVGSAEAPEVEVVGLVRDGKYAGLNESPQPYVCRPLSQAYTGATSVIVRGDGEPRRLIAAIRGEVSRLDPQLPLASARPLVERMVMPLLPARLAASVLGGLGLAALALAAIGIYGVMSYAVSSRTHEIGVRMALGAGASHVMRLAVGDGMRLVLIGTLIGLSAAWALTRLLTGLLYGVSASDPLTYAAVTVLLAGIALLACYVPARRATKIDPMIALRNE
jgi:predicted permease